MGFRVVTAALVLLCVAAPARAQQSVKLEFSGGQVTLRAQNAPARTILAEWARLGGATVLNGERVGGPPLTLELTSVPERQALDIILRSVAGYMLAPRRAGTTGASAFDRILILPTSTAPRTPATPPPPALGTARPVLPQPQVIRPPSEPGDEPDNDPGDVDVPVARPTPRGPLTLPRPGQPPQPLTPGQQVPDEDAPAEFVPEPARQEGVAPTPANPFGIPAGSTARPGVVTPVPQPQQPQGRQQP